MGTTLEISTTDLWFYSEADEKAFFTWLNSISAVRTVRGGGRALIVELTDATMPDGDLRELLSLYRRYGINMSELAQFQTAENAEWINDPQAYWYGPVFG